MLNVPQESAAVAQKITMYATPWCGDCWRAKRWFAVHGIPYDSINIDRDDQAAAYVIQINGGMRSVPTIVFPDGSVLVEPSARALAAKCFPDSAAPRKEEEISYPRFAASYNRKMGRARIRQKFDPLRRTTAGQAHGVVLEVGAGGGQNFPFYDPTRVVRVEAVEPDAAMLVAAGRSLVEAPVPIRLSRAPAEALPFPDAHFDSAVVTLVFCSVRDPQRSLREIWRVLKPGGVLLLLEHVRAQGGIPARVQDVLVPLTTRLGGNCHWNRAIQQMVLETGFQVTQVRQVSGGLQPMLLLQAIRPETLQEIPVLD